MEKREKKAIALRYLAEEDVAPLVLAKGQGAIAEAILALAAQAQIPVVETPELVGMLAEVEVGEYLPTEAYRLAAELIAFLWNLGENKGETEIKPN